MAMPIARTGHHRDFEPYPNKDIQMRTLASLAAITLLVPAATVAAPPRTERWSATSSTAMGITGDITLSPTVLTAAGKRFPLAVAEDVKDFGSDTGPQAARILRVTSPINPVLKNGNKLCTGQVRWIAVYRSDSGKSLNLSAFSGTNQPTSETGPDVCGTFLYSR